MKKDDVKVVILAGGFGTRLAEYTDKIPKPMVKIGPYPIIVHIMSHYASYGYNNFIIAGGYKVDEIKKYFRDFHFLISDFKVDLNTGEFQIINPSDVNWKVSVVNTGLNTMTGGRVKRLENLLEDDEYFLLTYGDGLIDANIDILVKEHTDSSKEITLTAVRPQARFGELSVQGNSIKSFKEKPQTMQGWINGGYFVVNRSFLRRIEQDSTVLEQSPLETAAIDGELNAHFHYGFWQCMDNIRDKGFLENLYLTGQCKWNAI